jgi:ATP-dependent RNA helicase DDX51/DBP6
MVRTLKIGTPVLTVKDLVPLPQPSNPPEVDTGPISSLPPWLSNPTVVQPEETKPFLELGISAKVLKNLEKRGFTKAFSIQTALVPLVLPGIAKHRGDICVSAPTGSGKTLAYAIPLVELLKQKGMTRLRAIVVVPTRELVQQVTRELEGLASGTGVKVGAASGSTPLAQEQKQIVRIGRLFDPEAAAAMRETAKQEFRTGFYRYDPIMKNMLPDHVPHFSSAVDILVCTPGRLVDHIESTRGFSLEDIEYLVIDEADRLLDESFQEWAEVLLSGLRGPEPETDPTKFKSMLYKSERIVQKIILSATMTRDVGRLAALQLENPTLVAVSQSNSEGNAQEMDLPSSLHEVAIPVGDGSKKPLYLLAMLNSILQPANEAENSDSEEDVMEEVTNAAPAQSPSTGPTSQPRSGNSGARRILVFTNNNEDAMRLRHILLAMDPELAEQVGTLTKMSAKEGRKALSRFKSGRTPVLIATDRASRGLDVPDLSDVVGYDAPRDLTTYVHRAGRTARAGRPGTAWSLYTEAEGWWFWNGIARAPALHRGGGRVHRGAVDVGAFEALAARYERALAGLKDAVAAGK